MWVLEKIGCRAVRADALDLASEFPKAFCNELHPTHALHSTGLRREFFRDFSDQVIQGDFDPGLSEHYSRLHHKQRIQPELVRVGICDNAIGVGFHIGSEVGRIHTISVSKRRRGDETASPKETL